MGLLDGLTGAIGDVVGGGLGLLGVQQQNLANADQANREMSFQADMSDTAHQREVADLKAAGLNPMLSVNAGASTPTGAMASMENTMQPVQQGMSNAIDASQKAKSIQQQGEMNDSTIQNNAANKNLIDKRAVTESANAREAAANADAAELQSQRIRAGQPAALKLAPYNPYIDSVGKAVGIGVNALEGGSAMGAAIKFMKSGNPLQQVQLPSGIPRGDAQELLRNYKQFKNNVPIGNPPKR